jgi:FKBP-type peptidyl-prolyl cis-trans isomerase
MTQIRLAILACGFVLACSTTEDGAAADGAENSAANKAPGGAANSAANSAAGGASGLPGLEAPADVAAPPGDAELRASGLASKRLFAGDGERSPLASDTVRVHYSGWQTNGVRFDSSVPKGKPAEFALTGVIAGWTEGLQLMVEGEERRFWIPESLAYHGQQGRPSGMLVFDVQLIAILP